MITTEKGFKKQSKELSFQRGHQVSDNFYELSKNKKKIIEMYPIHCGLTVLHYSKLILMEFVMFLHDFLEENTFELMYSGNILLFDGESSISFRHGFNGNLYDRFYGESGQTRTSFRVG